MSFLLEMKVFIRKEVIFQIKTLFLIFNGIVGKENRMYIKGEFKESLGMNFFSPFQPEREFKVYISCKCSQIICSREH